MAYVDHAPPGLVSRSEGGGRRPAGTESGVTTATNAGTPAHDFDALYAAHFDRLTLQLYAYAGDVGQAQDVVQEAFCRALARWSRLAEYDDPVGWVRRVAWNLATSRFRQLRRQVSFLQGQREQHAPAPSPDHVALTTALATLPAHQRQAVVMHYLADLSVTEIAQQTGVSSGTVKSRLHRGRTALAAAMSEPGGERTGADHA